MKIKSNITRIPIYDDMTSAVTESTCTIVGSSSSNSSGSSVLYPINAVYTQFPGMDDPNTLFQGTTWENITAQYAGAFFRAEGGNASNFNGGLQEQGTSVNGLQASTDCRGNHTHSWCITQSGTCPPTFCYYAPATTRASNGVCASCAISPISSSISTQYSGSHTHSVTLTGGTETRPINYTIRIWERTA